MSEKINALLKKHFENNRVVFWYDPNGEMREIFDAFSDPGVTKIVLDNDEFAVKYRILKQEPGRKFLIYAPWPRPEAENDWLLDLELANYVFSTDPAAMIAQDLGISSTLKPVLQERLGFFKNRSERLEPLSTLASSDWNVTDLLDAMLSVASARTKQEREKLLPLDTIIVSLSAAKGAEDRWRKIIEWKLDAHFFNRVKEQYSLDLDVPEPRGILLQLFSRAFVYQTGEDRNKTNRLAYLFIDTWRQQKPETELFEETAEAIEHELHVHEHLAEFKDDILATIDIYPYADKELLVRCSATLAGLDADLIHVQELVRKRSTTYWYLNDSEGQLRSWYDAMSTACQLLQEIKALKKGSTLRSLSKQELWEAYTTRLHYIDRNYRVFLKHYQNAGIPAILAASAERISAVYLNDFLKPLAERWQTVLDASNLLDMAPCQDEFFERQVARSLREGKRVYVMISDGLRWEAGAELARQFKASGKFNVDLQALRALVPTVTAHGMAALLPHSTLERDPEKNEVRIDGQTVAGIEGRSRHLEKSISAIVNGAKACAMTVEEFLKLSQEAFEKRLADAKLVYLYSSKIDTEGHSFDSGLPKAVDQELSQLMAAAKRIARLVSARIFITADHGFFFSGDAREDEFMLEVPPLPGETWRDQRYILGRNLPPLAGMSSVTDPEPALLGDVTALIAKGLMKIRRKGAVGNFIHGGMTLQELCIPVIQLTALKKDESRKAAVSVLASRDITTPSLAIKLYQEEPASGAVLPHRMRLWFESEDGIIISNKVECKCDSTDPEAVNRAFMVTFEFLPAARQFKGKQVFLKLYTIADGDTLIPFGKEEFRLKQIAYDIDVF